MGKPCSCMQVIKSKLFYYKSRNNPHQCYNSRKKPYQVLQLMCVRLNEIKGSYDKIITPIVPSYTKKYIPCLLPLALLLLLHTHNNTDRNKLVIQICTLVILVYIYAL